LNSKAGVKTGQQYRRNRLIAYLVCQTFLCNYPIYAFKRYQVGHEALYTCLNNTTAIHYKTLWNASSHITLQTTAIKYCIDLNKSLYCVTTLIGARRVFSFVYAQHKKVIDKRPLAASDITSFYRLMRCGCLCLFGLHWKRWRISFTKSCLNKTSARPNFGFGAEFLKIRTFGKLRLRPNFLHKIRQVPKVFNSISFRF